MEPSEQPKTRLDQIRDTAVNHGSSTERISWDDLGISVGRSIPQQDVLRDLTRLANSPTEIGPLIPEIVMHQEVGKITRTGAHVLGYAGVSMP